MKNSELTNYILLLIIIGWVVYQFNTLIMALIVAFSITEIFSVAVNKLEGYNISRFMSTSLIYLLLLVFLIVSISAVNSFYDEFSSEFKNNLASFQGKVSNFITSYISKDFEPKLLGSEKILKKIFEIVKNNYEMILANVFNFIGWLFFILFVSFIGLVKKYAIKKKIVDLVPNKYFESVLLFIYEIETQIMNYFNMQAIRFVIVTIITAIFLRITGLKLPFVMGVSVAILNIVPFLGPIAGAVLMIFVELLFPEFSASNILLYVGLNVLVVQIIDNFLLQPFLLSRGTEIGPISTLIALIVFGQIFGIVGMIFAIPMTNILMFMYKEIKKEYV